MTRDKSFVVAWCENLTIARLNTALMAKIVQENRNRVHSRIIAVRGKIAIKITRKKRIIIIHKIVVKSKRKIELRNFFSFDFAIVIIIK